MARALELAERGRGFVSPNPVVGAVLVRDGHIVGEGFHERYGGAHAEVNAMAAAGESARGATLYVTLEPCCVWGHTPPCTDAVLESGVSRIVVAAEDPNPDVSGRGVGILRARGLDVETGVMRDEAEAANEPYAKYRRTALPLVRLKMALTLDGRAAAPSGGPRWISCQASRDRVHAMRGSADCVMVGIGTVLADDPELTDRRETPARRQPARLVLDADLRIPHDSRLVAAAPGIRTVAVSGPRAPSERRRLLEELGVEVWTVRAGNGLVDLEGALRKAAGEGMIDILCEGGPRVAASLLRAGLADRVSFFLAPALLGGDALPGLGPLGPLWLDGTTRLAEARWQEVGSDLLVEARVVRTEEGDRGCSQA